MNKINLAQIVKVAKYIKNDGRNELNYVHIKNENGVAEITASDTHFFLTMIVDGEGLPAGKTYHDAKEIRSSKNIGEGVREIEYVNGGRVMDRAGSITGDTFKNKVTIKKTELRHLLKVVKNTKLHGERLTLGIVVKNGRFSIIAKNEDSASIQTIDAKTSGDNSQLIGYDYLNFFSTFFPGEKEFSIEFAENKIRFSGDGVDIILMGINDDDHAEVLQKMVA